MAIAIALGKRGLGHCWPNPAVGCVIVNNGMIVGRGTTRPGGRPHAEVVALGQAGERARGGTAYVTLEPCAHYGQTPPCADALLVAGVRRVVIACDDPDPRVDGRGIDKLQSAGVEVVLGIGAEAAAADLQGFFLRVREGRPLFTLKTATSADGRIALASGASQWITDPEARAMGHALRASHDGILVGKGTALTDDPMLTVRLPGLSGQSPVRILLDTELAVPATSRLAETASELPVWVVTLNAGMAAETWAECGAEIINPADMKPLTIARALGEKGLTRVLIEGGGQVAGSFLRHSLVDRIEWFRSSRIIGADGRPAIAPLDLDDLEDSNKFRREAIHTLGRDCWERYVHI
ncbi:MAG TPA: bifunctional diaminohydroxyphosphoribosylaminopyrimidine deaminase/5-amino-6-(5-phosphoribosylamino)uracil reductase RibD [Rhodospirillaceae bacterium]|nr:riboflavin biosynthesis protein RibD [Alphaproteobacteria bacterium]OUT42176.1 MAG: riboflavin biosynthesis protein RibD [Micavibrio sp. TMED2]HCI47523.1 bifunctional diaminohydroxyphosphoribosylaminopyrimidine deaminase/5-amino-6-(5-phosphoribosylamino)uracil reductase RibD [Rhodospirillaceae bacterium]MAS46207.1 riboflavin biosynthesis protein RibD [Alphaproteobacteria bacterium]MAX95610.1 riboflavin biosynthesis protein RibD [Alphaproteobacteria bacterium]|tara:strand:+ start:6919 stop:7974 length:1056 start_codon:yes stop_codon:yes gene_type:complete